MDHAVRIPSSWDGKKPVDFVLTMPVERPGAVYHVGETVTFLLELRDREQALHDGEVEWVLSKDSFVPALARGTVKLEKGRGAITGSLAEPGFLRCDATFKSGKDEFLVSAVAGIDPWEIKPSMPEPEDFDAFWAAKKKELAAVPFNFKLTPVPVPPQHDKAEAFDFQADCVGRPASGYYARPIGAKPKSCPALLYVHGAGVQSSEVIAVSKYAQQGFINIDLNAHGIPNGKPAEFYSALAEGELKDYRLRGKESRETFYFLNMYLRELRALDFLAAQPEWDGRTLIMLGVSQGGAQAIAATALDPRVSMLFTSSPALCDTTGLMAGRISGWPKMVPVDAAGRPDAAVLETARYFDTTNFAKRVRVPTYFAIGFIDTVTPPTGCYLAFNNIPGPKVVEHEPGHGHGIDNEAFWPKLEAMIAKEGAAAVSAAR
jgi:cephalosporin-C deacetylase-like acetyl esterase